VNSIFNGFPDLNEELRFSKNRLLKQIEIPLNPPEIKSIILITVAEK